MTKDQRIPSIKEYRQALDLLAGLHPELTVQSGPLAEAETIFSSVIARESQYKAEIERLKMNAEHLAFSHISRYEISLKHGPWLPSQYEEHETFCQRCQVRSVFASSRNCEPHIVLKTEFQAPQTA